jgi:hypothetical protein
MTLTEHLESNWLDYEMIEPNLIFTIKDVGIFLVIQPKKDLLFDEKFRLILDDTESELADSVDFFAFQFGGKWYYYSVKENVELKPLKNLGKVKL